VSGSRSARKDKRDGRRRGCRARVPLARIRGGRRIECRARVPLANVKREEKNEEKKTYFFFFSHLEFFQFLTQCENTSLFFFFYFFFNQPLISPRDTLIIRHRVPKSLS
jgi:hypothetical protein